MMKDLKPDLEPDPYLVLMDLDANPGNPKTYGSYGSGSGCGSGSPTLRRRYTRN
jgi:hypothetical protein